MLGPILQAAQRVTGFHETCVLQDHQWLTRPDPQTGCEGYAFPLPGR